MLLLAIGDSLTYGFPYSPAYSWTAGVACALGVEIENAGVCGATTDDMQMSFEQTVIRWNPDIVLILGGTNDAFEGVAEAEVEQNLRTMVEQAERYSVLPVIGLPIPCGSSQEEKLLISYRCLLTSFCTRKKIPVIDFYTPMLASDGRMNDKLYIDGVHPNVAGYEEMAKAATGVLYAVINPEQG